MTYPFVASYHDYGPAKGPRLGLVWHMAEGGGTVGYLAKPNPNGVAVHFVIERDGDIVQMLRLDHANGSIRPAAIRTTDDQPYAWAGVPVTYGATAAKAVLGTWWSDPNSATIGVECEGFAADGPTTAQATSMDWLWRDLSARYPGIRSLGHRDFADYKACPGKRIPWDRVGGHGLEEEPMSMYFVKPTPGTFVIPAGKAVRFYKPSIGGWSVAKTRAAAAAASGPVPFTAWVTRQSGDTVPSSLLLVAASNATYGGLYVSTGDVTETFAPPPPALTQADVDAAYNLGRDAAVNAAAATPRRTVA